MLECERGWRRARLLAADKPNVSGVEGCMSFESYIKSGLNSVGVFDNSWMHVCMHTKTKEMSTMIQNYNTTSTSHVHGTETTNVQNKLD